MTLTSSQMQVLQRSRTYTRKSTSRALVQVAVTLGGMIALMCASTLMPWYLLPCVVPVYAGLLMRAFVLQHDCGHRSLLRSARWCDRLGYLLSLFTSMPHLAWQAEHNWHHAHQGKLWKRGVDNMNSPMQLQEVDERLKEARYRVDKIRPLNIFAIGAHAFLIERKRAQGFFPFREAFTDRVAHPARIKRHIAYTLIAVSFFHMGLIWAMGLLAWGAFVIGMAAGAGLGGSLFWIQHNFEHTYHADKQDWNPVDVAVKGSSFLSLGRVATWFTAHIGHHHVHHLNPGIPNYNLETARQEIPELTQVKPMTLGGLRRSYTHLFWDAEAQRMRAPHELEPPLSER